MSNPKSRYLIGILLILVGILLFPALFYGIKEYVFGGGNDDAANVVAFLTGLVTFLTFTLIAIFFMVSGKVMAGRAAREKPEQFPVERIPREDQPVDPGHSPEEKGSEWS